MEISDRIRKLRKNLDLTQKDFGERIGLKSNSIALIEGGRNTSEQTLFAICREFGVNEEWLKTGNGEMFTPKASNMLEALAKERGLSHGAYIAIEKFLNLKPELQNGIIEYFREVTVALESDDILASTPAFPGMGMSADDLHKELDRQLNEEKDTGEKSRAL